MLRRLLDSPWTYFSLAGVLLVVLVATQIEIRMPPRAAGTIEDLPELAERDDLNVVFILIDTLRADRMSAYGYERETSPVMDYLADTGIRFDKTVAQSSWTKASMASLWTATWPRTNGILRWTHGLPDEATMPAEILREAGFRTAGLWRNGWVAHNFGFSQGFQLYLRPKPGRRPQQFEHHNPSAHPLMGTDEDLTVAAQEFLSAHGHERFFLYIHYMDVHQYAYDEISGKFGTSYSDVYDNSIHWVDRNVGVVIRELQDRDLMRETLVVIASDHGEGFREHGSEGHARTLYREVTYTPWIMALPFRLDPGVVVEPVVANVDIWPTVLDMLGLPLPGGIDGQSLVPLIEAAAADRPQVLDRPAFSEIDQTWGRPSMQPDPLIALTAGSRRMIRYLDEQKRDRTELYDHDADPWEGRNLLQDDGETAPPPEDLEPFWTAYLERDTPPWGEGAEEVELDDMQLNQLRALGYVIK